jgi:uroporphyrinogen decarboxylase
MSALKHQVPDIIPAYVRNVLDWERHAAHFGVSTLSDLKDHLGNTILSFTPAYVFTDPPTLPIDPKTGSSLVGMPPIWGIPEDMILTYTDSIPRPLANARTITDIDAYNWPSGSKDAWDFEELRERLLADTSHARMSPSWTPVFSQLCELFGMEEFLVKLHTNRPVIEAALDHLDVYYTEFFQQMLNTCGDQLEIFGIGDDFAYNKGMLIHPDVWRQLFKPLYAKWLGMAKGRDLLTLMHCCGLITQVLPDLIDIGLDAWQTVQTHLPGQDASRIKTEFGKHLAFVGAVDTTNVLGRATPEKVQEHVRAQIRILGDGGGYICAPDHTIMEEVASENVAVMYETIAAFRAPGFTLL